MPWNNPAAYKQEKEESEDVMENKLTKLFDYQKFAGNSKLQAVINSVRRQSRALISDDDAGFVAAAGAPYCNPADNDEKEKLL